MFCERCLLRLLQANGDGFLGAHIDGKQYQPSEKIECHSNGISGRFQEMKHDFFRAFRVDLGPAARWTSSVRCVDAHFLREWRRRLAQSSGDTPDWKWGRLLRPQQKASFRRTLLKLSKQTGRSRTHIFWKMKEAASSCRVFPGGRPPPVFRTCDKVSWLTSLLELSKPTVISQRRKTCICIPARSGELHQVRCTGHLARLM